MTRKLSLRPAELKLIISLVKRHAAALHTKKCRDQDGAIARRLRLRQRNADDLARYLDECSKGENRY